MSIFFFVQAEDGIRDLVRSRGLGDVYKRQLGMKVVSEKYGNLFDMYENIVGENAYVHAMKIYPAVHYTMGGLWVDYNLQSTVPGMYVLGEANFSDHGANRLGASALMQGLADGYFILPYTICLFYTSDAADERSSVDLGGRRIINKKTIAVPLVEASITNKKV